MTDPITHFLRTFAGTLTPDASEVHGNALQAAIAGLDAEDYQQAMMLVRGKVLELLETRQDEEVNEVTCDVAGWEVEL